jgi:hypothetical protein
MPWLWTNEANNGLAGVVATACVQGGDCTKHGKPRPAVAATINRRPARDRPGCRGDGEARSTVEAG